MKLNKLNLIPFICLVVWLLPPDVAAQCRSNSLYLPPANLKHTGKNAFLPPAKINSVLLPKWSAENLPFFCRIEHEWSKSIKKSIPLKFRLGSVEYVDWLEGKSWNPNQY
ncbi:MAG: hypothetical protein JNJ57_08765 [Saprospiraceae bacterium]|nr:hypothetical protein [Saprospiraceae bacterium]